jgi:hypothetical protein
LRSTFFENDGVGVGKRRRGKKAEVDEGAFHGIMVVELGGHS